METLISAVFNEWMLARRFVICQTSLNIGQDLIELAKLAERRKMALQCETGLNFSEISFAWVDGIVL